MSAIGDYVHRTWQGYEEKGIYKSGSSPNREWKTYEQIKKDVQQRAKILQNGLTQKDANKLKETLDGLMKNFKDPSSEYRKRAQKHMEETFGQSLGEINWETFDVTMAHKDWYVGKGKIGKKADSILDTQYMSKKLDQLNKAIINQQQGGELDVRKAQKILSECDKLQKEYEIAIENLKKDFQNREIPISLKSLDKSQASKFLQIREQYLNLIAEHAAYPNISLQKGELFEFVVGCLGVEIQAISYDEIEKALKGLTERENITYDFSAFSGNSLQQAMKKSKSDTTVYVSSNRVQGKVDVEFTWNQKSIATSVKNYQMSNEYNFVHILSGSPLSYMLQTEKSNFGFINHYLNLWSPHLDLKTNKEAKNPPSLMSTLGVKKDESGLSIKLLLFYKALTGDGLLSRKPANLFILNDRSKNSSKVLTMDYILQQVSENLSLASVQDGNRKKSILDKTFRFENPYSAATSEIRINALIASVHSTKISAAFKAGLIK